MTYQEWSEDYIKSAEILEEKIKNLKSFRKTAPTKMLKEIDARIYILYGMYTDCKKIAEMLYFRKGVAY